jgi:hypothetical protein
MQAVTKPYSTNKHCAPAAHSTTATILTSIRPYHVTLPQLQAGSTGLEPVLCDLVCYINMLKDQGVPGPMPN